MSLAAIKIPSAATASRWKTRTVPGRKNHFPQPATSTLNPITSGISSLVVVWSYYFLFIIVISEEQVNLLSASFWHCALTGHTEPTTCKVLGFPSEHWRGLREGSRAFSIKKFLLSISADFTAPKALRLTGVEPRHTKVLIRQRQGSPNDNVAGQEDCNYAKDNGLVERGVALRRGFNRAGLSFSS